MFEEFESELLEAVKAVESCRLEKPVEAEQSCLGLEALMPLNVKEPVSVAVGPSLISLPSTINPIKADLLQKETEGPSEAPVKLSLINTVSNTIGKDTFIDAQDDAQEMGSRRAGNPSGDAQDDAQETDSQYLVEFRNRAWRYFHHENPEKAISRLCAYALTVKADSSAAYRTARNMSEQMDFKAMYGKGDWSALLTKTFKRMAAKQKRRGSKQTVLTFMLEGDIRTHIPSAALYLPRLKQTITVSELAFIAKAITAKVLRTNEMTGRTSQTLSTNFFFNPPKNGDDVDPISVKYKKQTGRSLNRHKLTEATNLLATYGIITKEFNYYGGKRSTAVYGIGPNNNYAKKLEGRHG